MYFSELNTVPGSLAWYLFCQKLSEFPQMLTALVEQGICDFRARANKRMLGECGVLGRAGGRKHPRR